MNLENRQEGDFLAECMENKFKTFASQFALQAGQIIKKNFSLGMERKLKEDNTPVTETDLTINSMFINEVAKEFPEHSVLAEEQSNIKDSSEYVWVCDPVDGTIPFSHGIPLSTFSLALVKNGKVILGVVNDPFSKRLFVTEKGKGTFLNNKAIRVSTTSLLENAVGDCEMSKRAKYNTAKLTDYLVMSGVKLIKLKSIIYPSALVAAGELDFTIFPHTTPWDAASVKIIVEEAGGKVTDIFGNEQKYDKDINGFVASNGVLHDQLINLTSKLVSLKTRK